MHPRACGFNFEIVYESHAHTLTHTNIDTLTQSTVVHSFLFCPLCVSGTVIGICYYLNTPDPHLNTLMEESGAL